MDLAQHIEHTLLRPEATVEAVDRLCEEALAHRFCGVCVNPLFVERAARRLEASPCRVVTVVGFPLGANLAETKAEEARQLVALGAHEVDMVIPVGLALGGDLTSVTEHVASVREGVPNAVLKVILETGFFDRDLLARVAGAVLRARPDYLKTSTGFGPRGADADEVRWLAKLCPEGVRLKAAGGIRTREVALAMLAAGATRLGTSGSLALLGAEQA